MRDPERIDEYCEQIKEIWKAYPDMRFTQLILNLANDPGWYYVEDDTFFETLNQYYIPKENK